MYCAFLDMNPYLKNITIIDSSQQSPYTRWGRNTYVSVITSVAGSIHFDAMEVLIYKKVLYRNFLVNISLFHYKKSIIHVIFFGCLREDTGTFCYEKWYQIRNRIRNRRVPNAHLFCEMIETKGNRSDNCHNWCFTEKCLTNVKDQYVNGSLTCDCRASCK